MDSDLQSWERKTDRRKFRRVRLKLDGKLFLTDEKREVDCVITDLSAGGAGIRCKISPPPKTKIVLYAGGFGRFEGVTTTQTKDGTGIRFTCTERRRQRLVEQLTLYVSEGITAITSLRENERLPPVVIPNFTSSEGEVVECEVLDISLTGVSIKTDSRPAVNEVIKIGRMEGLVVRHHEHGIGVKFMGELRNQQTARVSAGAPQNSRNVA